MGWTAFGLGKSIIAAIFILQKKVVDRKGGSEDFVLKTVAPTSLCFIAKPSYLFNPRSPTIYILYQYCCWWHKKFGDVWQRKHQKDLIHHSSIRYWSSSTHNSKSYHNCPKQKYDLLWHNCFSQLTYIVMVEFNSIDYLPKMPITMLKLVILSMINSW